VVKHMANRQLADAMSAWRGVAGERALIKRRVMVRTRVCVCVCVCCACVHFCVCACVNVLRHPLQPPQ